jgi:hypothetical protein
MSAFEDISKLFTKDNVTFGLIILLFVMVFYVNMKINDVDYRLRQTIMYRPDRGIM